MRTLKVTCPGDGAYQVNRTMPDGHRYTFVRYPNGAKVVYRDGFTVVRVKHYAQTLLAET